ncbi:putative autophagy protein Apg12 [Paraphaeosphaeria sporulosa]|uniref:Ubiquitin-like protein ATG12 n=1 Tax=Paraphaeosphaeria sporulosa TaxID=1460663 RepID=A0A177CYQ5_9PLEO|nr:putative autophagy protein Apg12 [Paraphaeosphaeria sporulosa]OAG12158.1 putative autophagy protein Apg12 [Paraphaeosphaeria sporulosa]
MAASTMLTTLPVDAKEALATDGKVHVQKVRIHLVAIGSAPRMSTMVFMMTASNRFEVVVRQIRNKLKLKPHESVFCYIGNVFSPALDESVENLWRCFKQGQKEELYVGYALSQAFG